MADDALVFLAGGEDGVCGGRHFSARPAPEPFSHLFDVSEGGIVQFRARNLGEIRDGIEKLVNADV